VDGAVLVWCSPLPWLRPVLLTPPLREWLCLRVPSPLSAR
jgi:hypothetical protein